MPRIPPVRPPAPAPPRTARAQRRSHAQPADVGGAGSAVVDDEVGVQVADLRPSLPGALQARRLHEPACGVSRRVLEDRAAVLGLDGLGAVALGGQARHLALGGLSVARPQLDGGGGDQGAVQRSLPESRRSVAEPQRLRRPGGPALTRHVALDLDQHLTQLAAPTAGVLVDGAAHAAGDADRKLEADQPGIGRQPGQAHHLQTRARAHARAVDLVLAVDDPQHQAVESGVRDQQVGARAQDQVRHAPAGGLLHHPFHLVHAAQLAEPGGRPPDVEGGVARQRVIALDPGQRVQPDQVSLRPPAHVPTSRCRRRP